MKKQFGSYAFWYTYLGTIIIGVIAFALASHHHSILGVWIAIFTVIAAGIIGGVEERSRGITKLLSSKSSSNIFQRLRDGRQRKIVERKDALDLESVRHASTSTELDCLLRLVRPNSEAFWLAFDKLDAAEMDELRSARIAHQGFGDTVSRISIALQDRHNTIFMPMLYNTKSQKEREEIRQRLAAASRSRICSILEVIKDC